MPALTLERARALLAYDPDTGLMTWRVSRGPIKARSPAGTRWEDGYWTVVIDRKRYLLHRLAWFLIKGVWPASTLDHRDTDPSNNRWKNLREATGGQNSANRNVQSNSALGIKGVRERKGRFSPPHNAEGVRAAAAASRQRTCPSFIRGVISRAS